MFITLCSMRLRTARGYCENIIITCIWLVYFDNYSRHSINNRWSRVRETIRDEYSCILRWFEASLHRPHPRLKTIDRPGKIEMFGFRVWNPFHRTFGDTHPPALVVTVRPSVYPLKPALSHRFLERTRNSSVSHRLRFSLPAEYQLHCRLTKAVIR